MFDLLFHKPGQFQVKDVMLAEGTGYRHMCHLCHVVLFVPLLNVIILSIIFISCQATPPLYLLSRVSLDTLNQS